MTECQLGKRLLVKKTCWSLLCLALLVLLAACGGSGATSQYLSSSNIAGDSLQHSNLRQSPTPTPTSIPIPSIPSQKATPTPVPSIIHSTPTPPPVSNCVIYSNETTLVPQKNGT